jgi:hypothetical protein
MKIDSEKERRFEFKNIYSEIYLSMAELLSIHNSRNFENNFFGFLMKQKSPIFAEHIQNYLIGASNAYEHRGGDGKDEITRESIRLHEYFNRFGDFIQDVNIPCEEKLNIIKNYSTVKNNKKLQEMCEKELELIGKGEKKPMPKNWQHDAILRNAFKDSKRQTQKEFQEELEAILNAKKKLIQEKNK